MFIVEGLMASAVGAVAFFYLCDRPKEARWLSPAERDALAGAIAAEEADKPVHGQASFRTVLTDRRVLLFCLSYFTIQVSVYGVVFYLPTRIAGLMGGHLGSRMGWLTAIPWLVAIPVTLAVTRLADRTGRHERWAAVMLAIAACGILASSFCGSAPTAILAFCLATAGFASPMAEFCPVFDVEVGNELFYYIFEGEPQPVNGYLQLSDETPGLGLSLSDRHLADFNIIE